MLELEKTKLELKIDGVIYAIKFPTVGIYKKYDKRLQDKTQASDAMIDLLVELGLEKKIVDDLEFDHLTQIINKLIGTEKKN